MKLDIEKLAVECGALRDIHPKSTEYFYILTPDQLQAFVEAVTKEAKAEKDIKLTVYERLDLVIQHAKLSNNPFDFLCRHIEAMKESE